MVLKINSVARGLKKGIHPLQMAIDRGNMDLVEALVNKGAEIDRQCYYPGGYADNAIRYALKCRQRRIANFLRRVHLMKINAPMW